jgi:hypothetical protein
MNTNHPDAASLRATALSILLVGSCLPLREAPPIILSALFALQVADRLERGQSWADAMKARQDEYMTIFDPQLLHVQHLHDRTLSLTAHPSVKRLRELLLREMRFERLGVATA